MPTNKQIMNVNSQGIMSNSARENTINILVIIEMVKRISINDDEDDDDDGRR